MQGKWCAAVWHGCPIGAYGRKMQVVRAIPPGLCAGDSEKQGIADKLKPLSMFAVQTNKEHQLCARAR